MNILLRVIFVVLLVFSFSQGVIAATEDSADQTTVAQDENSADQTTVAQGEDAATEPAAEIPDSVDMNLGFDESSNPVLPAGFRGGDPDSGLIHCLEDVYYEKQEHSIIYNPDASDLGEGAKFEGEPNIQWTVQKVQADGSLGEATEEEGALPDPNTNIARNGGKFYSPGEYQIGNGGARQVAGGGEGVEADTPADGTEPAAGGSENVAATTPATNGNPDAAGENQTAGAVDADGNPIAAGENQTAGAVGADGNPVAAGETKQVQATQSMGVLVHDCTSPDVWIAFQEGAGNVDMAKTKSALKKQMIKKIVANSGRPFSSDPNKYEDASYLFIDEGTEKERNVEPNEKTARLSIAGCLFNEAGAPEFETGIVQTKLMDKEKQTRQTFIGGGPEKSLKGVFVRRNVPFIFAALSADNGNHRKVPGKVICRIEKRDGTPVDPVDKSGEAYQFRVPNYPREEYPEQPDYFFVSSSRDNEGNYTTVRMPLYVVNTQVAYEGGVNR